MSARQLDADRFAARDNAAEPMRLLPALRAMVADLPQAPIPAQIEFSAEQIMLGGRPVQNLAAEFESDTKSWSIDAAGCSRPRRDVAVADGHGMRGPMTGNFKGALSVESSDPDTLVAWLQGRSEVSYRSQKPLRLRGDVSVAEGSLAIEALQAEIDGGAVEGRVSLSNAAAGGGTRLDAELKGERLDLDAAAAFARSLAGPQAEWPDEARLSLDIGRAISAGQELRPFTAKLGYDPKTVSLDQLKIGEASGVTLEGSGAFDRVNATGKLALNSSAASLDRITALIAPLAPALSSRLEQVGTGAGPARLKLTLDLDKDAKAGNRADARAVLDLDAPQLKGSATVTATPEIAALRGIDLDALRRSEFGIESKFSSDQGRTLLALLGLDRAVAAADGPAQFEGSVTGVWHAPLRLKARISGAGLDAEAQGTADPWAQDAKASVSLNVRSVSLAPLLDLKPSDTLAQNISFSSRVSLAGNRLTFDDLDSTIAGSRLRGHLAVTLGGERNVEGEVGLDTLDLAPAFALALGAAGRDAAEPLGAGLLKGWRGQVAFQALRGALPGGVELRPVGGTVKSDGQSLSFDAIKGGIGGGEATATVEARPSPNGIALNARVELKAVDGAALHYRSLAMPAGRVSMQMTLASQGRSASALTGALSGSGTVTLESARIAGLDPRAFDAAIRASDSGQATDDRKLRQIVEPVLSAGALSVKSAQIPFSIGDGRLRVGATTLEADGARAIISGGYDIPADQADIRASLASTAAGGATGGPEIQLFAVGSPDALDRNLDVASLSSWLAVRAIDRETRRLDSIERGEPLPALPASIPPPLPLRRMQRLRINRFPACRSPAAIRGGLRCRPESARRGRRLRRRRHVRMPPSSASRPRRCRRRSRSARRLAPAVARPPKPKPPLALTPPAASPPPR